MKNDNRAIILAAGRGSRMGGLTDNLPKCRTILHNKELIQWQLDALSGAGISHISIVRGYLAGTFDFDIHYFENNRWNKTNMVSSLIEADSWLKESICVVSYSDIVYSKNIVNKLVESEGDIVIAYDPKWKDIWSVRFDDPLSDAESFSIDINNRVVEIGEKVDDISKINGQYMGLLKFTPNGWNQVLRHLLRFDSSSVDVMDMTSLLSSLIKDGVRVDAVSTDDCWYEVDTQNDLKVYSNMKEVE
jgi:choline kinase